MTSLHTSLPELQTAFLNRLLGDATLMGIVTGVFDYGAIPTLQPYPYIAIGDSTEGPENAFGTRGYLSSLTLHIWDNRPGFARCYQILARMNDLLDQQIVGLATLKHVYTLYDFSQTLNDPGLDDVRHMPVRYLTFAQEVASVATQDVNLLQVNGAAVSPSNPVPVSGPVTIVDGGDVTQGSMADAAWSGTGSATQVAILKKLVSLLTATLAVSGTVNANVLGSVTANAGTNLNTSLLAVETGGNLASLATSNSAVNAAVGTQADAAWSGSGSGSEIAILKKIVAELAGTLSATISGTVAVSNFPATQPVSGTVTASIDTTNSTHLATIDTNTAASKTDLDTLAGAIASGKAQANVAQIGGQTPTLDNTTILAASMRVKTTVAGDTALAVGNATMANSLSHSIASDDTLTTSIKNSVANIPAKGSATSANSSPVVVASDQAAIPIKQGPGSSVTAVPSAAYTTTQTQADQTNSTAKGIRVFLNVSNAGTGSVTLEIDGKDSLSATYYSILTGAAVTVNGFMVYTIYPTVPASANAIAQDYLPTTYRIKVVANNANSVTYSVGYILLA